MARHYDQSGESLGISLAEALGRPQGLPVGDVYMLGNDRWEGAGVFLYVNAGPPQHPGLVVQYAPKFAPGSSHGTFERWVQWKPFTLQHNLTPDTTTTFFLRMAKDIPPPYPERPWRTLHPDDLRALQNAMNELDGDQ